jgi:uncharacterized protein YegL
MKRIMLLLGLLFATPVLADDHIVILLDTSGSMSESMRTVRVTKMSAAQGALDNLILQMPTLTTKMGLLTFNGWAFPIGPLNKAAASAAIEKTYASGGTPLGEYMKIGADSLLETREKNHGVGTYTLLVVTDGEANDNRIMLANTADIVSRGLTLKTIGVNLSQAHTLATRSVAYFPADNPEALKGALEKAVAEVPAGDDNIEEDAYAMLSGIPAEMAPQLIEAITKTIKLNQPIGEKPKIKVVDEKGNVSFVVDPIPPDETKSGGIVGLVIFVVFIVVVIVLFAIIVGKS